MMQPPELQQPQQDDRPHDEAAGQAEAGGPDGGPAKQVKVDINPLTGLPYTRRFYELLERRQRLPTWSAREDILKLIQKHQAIVLAGETGSGKTTQLPQILLDAGYHVQSGQIKAITCVQPRDLAATNAAQRVSDELEVQPGTYVGYALRYEDRTSMETLLKFLSDEALLQELLLDPMLERHSVVILDEAHERTLPTDLLLGYLKGVMQRRPELKLVIMSATTDMNKVQRHFGDAPLLTMPGRSRAVDIFYMGEPDRDYLRAAVRTAVQIHTLEPEGDVLLFLTGPEEIEHACVQLRREGASLTEAGELIALPLYQGLAHAAQQKVFEPAPGPTVPGGRGGRKVVVATEVAETALALDNIVYVIDPGLARQRVYNPRIRLQGQLVLPISRSSASRRAACAGRTRPGKCFRLYAEKSFMQDLPQRIHPEALRSDLSATVLSLKRLRVEDLVHFEFVDAPSPEAMMRALETLHHLSFLDDNGDLTNVGEQASVFPVEPELARMLIDAPGHKCSNEALSIAAMLSVQPVFVRPDDAHKAADEAKHRFAHLDGDHLTLLNVFHAYKQHCQDGIDPAKFCGDNYINLQSMRQAENIREHLKRLMDQMNYQMVSTDFQDKEYYPNIRRCLVSGFFMRIAHLEREKSGTYLTVKESQEVTLHPSTCLKHKPEWVLYHEFTITSKSFIKTGTQVRGEWLLEIAPQYYDMRKLPRSDAKAALEKIVSRQTTTSPGRPAV